MNTPVRYRITVRKLVYKMLYKNFLILTLPLLLLVQTKDVLRRRPVVQNSLLDLFFRVVSRAPAHQTTKAVNVLSNLTSSLQIRNYIIKSAERNYKGVVLVPMGNSMPPDEQFAIDYKAGLQSDDMKLNITQLASKYGYTMERHKVITEDGYVLTLFRIPNNGSVVFIMHGLLGSADNFLIPGPENSLAYMLAEEGYDVWLGNAKGSKYSRKHIKMKPSEARFWDFSWHEIGVYDLPAMIDYILDRTGEKSLKYIGHSQGTTVFFVMVSERPIYNEKVSLMIAMSPVAYMSHEKTPISWLLAPISDMIYSSAKAVGVYELLPDNPMIRTIFKQVCENSVVSEVICSNMLFLFTGFGFEQMNVTLLSMILSHGRSGASLKQLAHYAQEVLSGRFRQYDYDIAENMKRYGSKKPPDYNLKNVVTQVSMLYSDADWLSDSKDVMKLNSELTNVVDLYEVPFHPFSHLDFLIGKDVKRLVYRQVSKILKKF